MKNKKPVSHRIAQKIQHSIDKAGEKLFEVYANTTILTGAVVLSIANPDTLIDYYDSIVQLNEFIGEKINFDYAGFVKQNDIMKLISLDNIVQAYDSLSDKDQIVKPLLAAPHLGISAAIGAVGAPIYGATKKLSNAVLGYLTKN